MAKLVFSMNVSVDGYVAPLEGFAPPGAQLFRHWIEHVRGLAGSLYGRRLYEAMQYWDEDQAACTPDQREFATAWRRHPKWVVSRSLKSVGPNATLVDGNVETFVHQLKAEHDGEIAVGGPMLAASLGEVGLVDEYRLYVRPFVLGRGDPYFARSLPPLKLIGSDRIGEDAMRLTYVPS